ncbi:ABC transporter substrate-binding protein [Candidatus Phytoplasma fraxini]|uniref:Oligopeptide ABC transporter substrate-binding protein (OppA) n=1 Tax=Ash yellows phytoplasma TaxID=35780 RepID=A0ABZ2U8V8_ASHYP
MNKEKIKNFLIDHKIKILIITTAIIALSITGYYLLKSNNTNENLNECRIALPNDIKGFDVTRQQVTGSTYSDYILSIMHDTLLSKDKDQNIIKQLLSDYKRTDNGKTIKCQLKNNIFFHNGEELTTDDIIFTYNRAENNEHPQFLEIEKITKTDNKNFEIQLKENNLWTDFKFYRFFRVLNKKAVVENETEGLKIGCGPYKLTNYTRNDKLEFELFDKYHNKDRIQNSPKQLKFKISKDDDTLLQEIEQRKLDALISYPASKINNLEKLKDKINIITNNSVSGSYIYINKDKVNLEKRKAIAQTIDPLKIKEELQLPSQILTTYIPQSLIGHNETLQRYTNNNIDLIQKTVEKFSNTQKRIKIGLSSKNTIDVENKIIEQLRNVGFDVSLTQTDFNTLLEEVKGDSYDMIFLGENHELEYGHKAFSDYFLSINNNNNFCHINLEDKPHIEDKLTQAAQTSDKNEYIRLIKEVSKYIHDQYFVIPLYLTPNYCITSKLIQKGFETDVFGNFDFTSIIKKI